MKELNDCNIKASIFDKYDLVDIDNEISIPEKPSEGVTVIVGGSGTGKTSILRAWGMAEQCLDLETPIYKQFKSEEEAEHYLICAGLRSVPAWKRSLSSVSNGERHRAEVAIALSFGEAFIDEFTSVVDRDTARALCNSLNKFSKQSVCIATCHKDILSWLNADNIYSTDLNAWIDRGALRRDREITIDISPCDTQAVWEIFGKHHYLSGKINKSANSFVATYNGKPVGMTSIIAFPSGNWKDGWRGHRTVVLPEFQGMGIGSALSDYTANMVISNGGRFFSKTSHPAFGEHRERSEKWKATSKNKVIRNDYLKGNRKTKEDGHKLKHAKRSCYSHEYIG